jgi:pyridoxine kinase
MKENILSIQSRVAYGFVGGNIADLILKIQGIDVISVPTVILSTNAEDKKRCMGESLSFPFFSKILKGVGLLDAFDDVRYIISGYFADRRLMEATSHFVKEQKKTHTFSYICDPVMGDYRAGGLYVPKRVADYYVQHLIASADIITPNKFEIEYILGKEVASADGLLKEINDSNLLCHKTVVVTSAELNDTEENTIETIIVKDKQLVRLKAARVDIEAIGTGDLFTSLMTSFLLRGETLEQAVSLTMDFVTKVVEYLKEQGRREMTAESIVRFARQIK